MNARLDMPLNGLQWVRGELEQSISRARVLIEQQSERGGDPLPLQQAYVELHQVRGTAQMIRCGGAAMLAGEMAAALHDLLAAKVRQPDMVYGALLGACLQLSDYLQALAEERGDCALVLQPAINELRLARGQAVLTESELFVQQLQLLDRMLPLPPHDEPLATDALGTQLRRLSPIFQASLLSWIRNAADAQTAAARIGKIAEQLAPLAARAEVHQLLRVAAATIEALLGRGLDNSLELKRLFGRVEQLLKQIVEQGETPLAAAAQELSLQLLFLVGRSSGSGPRVQALRQQFELDLYLPSVESLELRRRRIHGPNTALLAALAGEIRQDFARIKDHIDLAVRAGGVSTDGFANTRKGLQRIADVLGGLGLGTPQQQLLAQVRTLESLGPDASPAQWLAFAEALLRVENGLEDLFHEQLRPRTDADAVVTLGTAPAASGVPSARDVADSINALYRESLVNLARVKTLVDGFLRTGNSAELPDAVLLIDEVAAGAEIVGHAQAAEATRRLQRFVAGPRFVSMRGSSTLSERFAETVAALEYYLELARDGTAQVYAQASQLEEALDALDAASEGPTAAPATAPAAAPAATAAAPAAGDDEEIRAVFFEETVEVLARLRGALAAWARDPRDRDSLTTIRRAFHTLKGSGRMVGATEVGEFAWEFERLLNRCLDGSVAISAGIVALVAQAVERLPALIDAFRDQAPAVELGPLVERAQAYAENRDPDAASVQDLAAVFRDDAGQQLAAVQARFAALDRDLHQHAVDPETIRAFHTLRGAARLVEAPAVSELAAALERWLDRLLAAHGALDDAGLELLEAATEALQKWVAEVGTPAAAQQDAQLWLQQIESLQGSVDALHEDDEARRLAEVFAGEALDLVQRSEALIRQWAQAPEDRLAPIELQAVLQTLAGAAQMAPCAPLAAAASALRSRIDAALAAPLPPSKTAFARLGELCEAFYQQLDGFRDGRLDGDGAELVARIHALDWAAAAIPAVVADVAVPAASAAAAMLPPEPQPEPQPAVEPAPPASTATSEPPVPAMPLQDSAALDPELLIIFVAEAEELLEQYEHGIASLERAPRDAATVAGLMRTLHTLKGSARVSGLAAIGDRAHAIESLLEHCAGDTTALGGELRRAGDELRFALDALQRGEAPLPSAAPAAVPDVPPAADRIVLDAGSLSLADFDAEPEAAAPDLGLVSEPPIDAAIEPVVEPLIEPAIALSPEPAQPPADDAVPAPTPSDESADFAPAAALTGLPDLPPPVEAEDRAAAGEHHAIYAAPPVGAPSLAEPPPSADQEMLAIFASEAVELAEQLEQAFARWQVMPTQPGPAQDLQRTLHTLKGAARTTGAMVIGDAAHELETRIAALSASGVASAEPLAPVGEAIAGLRRWIDRLERGDWQAVFAASAQPAAVLAPTVSSAQAAAGLWDPELFWKPADDGEMRGTLQRETARVAVETLETLLNEAGEVSINRARIEEQQAGIQTQLGELSQVVARIREQLRQLDIETDAQIAARGRNTGGGADRYAGPDRYAGDFDPLEMDRYTRMQELSRALAESAGDLAAIHGSLDGLGQQAVGLLQQQARVNTAVQQGLMRTLMVPFARQTARLQRVAAQTAHDTGKDVEVRFSGVEAELDRNVLERMTAPLEHLIRNAVVHGIEKPELRRERGKPVRGVVEVRLWREGTQLRVELRDDGNGLDFDSIRATAIRRGLVPGDAAPLSDEAAAQYIFMPGFSTASELTQSAGRGVGMDVVAAEVKQLGGTLELASEAGLGTRFLIRLPLNLALAQALLVETGGELYAVPLPSVEGIVRLPREQLHGEQPSYRYGEIDYRLAMLGDFIGAPAMHDADARMLYAMLVRLPEGLGSGERRYAVVVERLIGNREIVSKPVGPQISGVPGVTGATILADGRAVLILDLATLVQDQTRRELRARASRAVSPPSEQRAPIMVVDDSLTIRRVTERLLQRNGYEVVTARDGLDAMAQLQTLTPAVILLDIEMPRADGFEVAAYVRNTPRLATTPILMITSRSGDKHRERAAALGVNAYMIKPYQEDQLLSELAMLKKSA